MPTAADVSLAEYHTLKQEQTSRINTRAMLLYFAIGLAGAAAAVAAQTRQPSILLGVPFAGAALGWHYLTTDTKITAITQYLRDVLAPHLSTVVGEPVLRWETVHQEDPGRGRRHRNHLAVDVTVFALTGVVAALTGAVGVLTSHTGGLVKAVAVGAAGVGILLASALGWEFARHADLPHRRGGPGTGGGGRPPAARRVGRIRHLWTRVRRVGITQARVVRRYPTYPGRVRHA